jgi:hypothetical protein
MLQLEVVTAEDFDEHTLLFIAQNTVVLQLEHSLVSMSKWESEWKIPFLSSDEKTPEQTLSYVLHMILPGDYPPQTLQYLNSTHFEKVNEYIADKMTATWVHEDPQTGPHEIVTSELIYYWMIALGIPVEFQHWHLNRLMMLIRVCNIKNNAGNKKPNPRNSAARRKELNDQRRKELGTKG